MDIFSEIIVTGNTIRLRGLDQSINKAVGIFGYKI